MPRKKKKQQQRWIRGPGWLVEEPRRQQRRRERRQKQRENIKRALRETPKVPPPESLEQINDVFLRATNVPAGAMVRTPHGKFVDPEYADELSAADRRGVWIRKYQRAVGLKPTGILDDTTWQLVNRDAAMGIGPFAENARERLGTAGSDALSNRLAYEDPYEVIQIRYLKGEEAARERLKRTITAPDRFRVKELRRMWPSIPPATTVQLARDGIGPDDPRAMVIALLGARTDTDLGRKQQEYLNEVGVGNFSPKALKRSPVWKDFQARLQDSQQQEAKKNEGGGGLLNDIVRTGFTALAAPYEELQGLFRNTVSAFANLPETAQVLSQVNDPNLGSLVQASRERSLAEASMNTIDWKERFGLTGTPQWGPQSMLGIQIERAVQGKPASTGTGLLPDPDSEVGRAQARRARQALSVYGHGGTLGRVAAWAVGLDPDDAAWDPLSGVVDAAAILTLDPANVALSKLGQIRRARKTFAAADTALESAGLFQGIRKMVSPRHFEDWLARRGQRVVDFLAKNTDFELARQILGRDARLAAASVDAQTPEAVADLLRNVAGASLSTVPRLPRRGRTHGLFLGGTAGFLAGATEGEDLESAALGGLAGAAGGFALGRAAEPIAARYPQIKPSNRRIFGLLPGDSWHIDDVDEFTEQMTRYARNANLSPEEVSDFGYRAATTTGRAAQEQLMEEVAGRAAERMLERAGAFRTPPAWVRDKVEQATRIFNTHRGQFSRYVVDTETGDNIVPPQIYVNGEPHVAAPARMTEVLTHDQMFNRQSLRDIRRLSGALAPFYATEGGKVTEGLTLALDFFYTKAFKPLALITRVAYPLRVLGEQQLRQAAAGYPSFLSHPIDYIAFLVGRRGTVEADDIFAWSDVNALFGEIDEFARARSVRGGTFRLIDTSNGRTMLSIRDVVPKGRPGYENGWIEELVKLHQDPVTRKIAEIGADKTKRWLLEGKGQSLWRKMIDLGEGWENLRDPAELSAYVDWLDEKSLKPFTRGDPDLTAAVVTGLTPHGDDLMSLSTGSLRVTDEARRMIEDKIAIGPEFVPATIGVVGKTRFGQHWDNAIQTLFAHMMGSPDDHLNRSVVWRVEYWREVARLAQLTDAKTAAQLADRARRVFMQPYKVMIPVRFAGTAAGILSGAIAADELSDGDLEAVLLGATAGGIAGYKAAKRAKPWLDDKGWRVIRHQPTKLTGEAKRIVDQLEAAARGARRVVGGDLSPAERAARAGIEVLDEVGKTKTVPALLPRAPKDVEDAVQARVSERGVLPGKRSGPRVREQVGVGQVNVPETMRPLTAEEIDNVAKANALARVKSLLYDLSERSQMMDVLRFIFPFGDAFREVITRWTGIIRDHPEVIRRGQLAIEGARDSGVVYRDEYGEEVFAYPFTGQITKELIGVPIPLEGSVQGLNLVTSIVPGTGPAVQIPAKWFIPDTPQWNQLRELIYPFGMTEGGDLIDEVIDSVIPAFADKLRAAFGSQAHERLFMTTTMQIDSYLATTGNYPLTAEGLRRRLEDAKEKAKEFLLFRAVASNIGPSAPIPKYSILDRDGKIWSMAALSDELRRLETEDYDTAALKFVSKYGLDTWAAVATKAWRAVTHGLPYTKKQTDWVRSRPGIAEKYPFTHGYFAPEDPNGDPDRTELARQERAGLRQLRDPAFRQRVMNDMMGRYILDARTDQLLEEHGVSNTQELPEAAQQERRALRARLRKRFPGFESKAGEVERVTQQELIAELRKAVKDPQLRDTEVARGLRIYLNERDWVADEYARRRGRRGPGRRTDGWMSAKSAADLRRHLAETQRTLKKAFPAMGRVLDFVFSLDVRVGWED